MNREHPRRSAAKVVVCKRSELRDGQRRIFEVNGRSIGVFNVEGALYALLNRCPHQNGPLCLGDILTFVDASKPGDYRFVADRKIISCPWHGWEFDLRTGQSYFDPSRTRVKPYPVELASGGSLSPEARGGTACGAGGGPEAYVADVIPVSIDDDYVVVTMRI